MAELQVKLTDGRTWRQPLTRQVQVMGRDPSCDIVLDDPSASRRHARLRFESGRYILDDLGSKNGTLVNDERVQAKELTHQDEILVGSVEVRFLEADPTTDRPGTVVVTEADESREKLSYASRSAALQLTERRLQMLYDLSERLTTLRHRDELLEDALSICFETLRFERGAIAVRKANRGGVDWPVVRNLRSAGGELTVSRSILGRAMDHGERAIYTEGSAERIDPTVSMVQLGIRSAMCVPLLHGDKILGVIYGDRITTGTIYSKEDVDFLAGIARQVTIGLINAQLLEEQKAKLELEKELAVAREIQQGLFPKRLPEREGVTIATLNEPGRLVSGDYFDVLELPRDRIGFLIADVTGKGVAASLLMSNLQAAVRLSLPTCDDLGSLMTRWNDHLFANTDSTKFVTCLTGILDLAGRRLSLCTAGHPLPFLLRESGESPSLIETEADYPLGVVEGATYRASDVPLGDGPCTVFCYTDGIYEAMSAENEQFGDGRMIKTMTEGAVGDPHGLVRRMRKAVATFCRDAPQSDDITMIALRLA